MATTPRTKLSGRVLGQSTPFPNHQPNLHINDVSPINLNKSAVLHTKKRRRSNDRNLRTSILKTDNVANTVKHFDSVSKGCVSGSQEPSSTLELDIESSDDEFNPPKKVRKTVSKDKKSNNTVTKESNKRNQKDKLLPPTKKTMVNEEEIGMNSESCKIPKRIRNSSKTKNSIVKTGVVLNEVVNQKKVEEELEINIKKTFVEGKRNNNMVARKLESLKNELKETKVLITIDEELEVIEKASSSKELADPIKKVSLSNYEVAEITEHKSRNSPVLAGGNELIKADSKKINGASFQTVDDDNTDDKKKPLKQRVCRPRTAKGCQNKVDDLIDENKPELVDGKVSNEKLVVIKTKNTRKRNPKGAKKPNNNVDIVGSNESIKTLEPIDAIESYEHVKQSKANEEPCDKSKELVEDTVINESSNKNLKSKCQRQAVEIAVDHNEDGSICKDNVQVEMNTVDVVHENNVSGKKSLNKSNMKDNSLIKTSLQPGRADSSKNSVDKSDRSVIDYSSKSKEINDRNLTDKLDEPELEHGNTENEKLTLQLNNSRTRQKASALSLSAEDTTKERRQPHNSCKNGKFNQIILINDEAIVSSNSDKEVKTSDLSYSEGKKKEKSPCEKKSNEVTSCTITSTIATNKKSHKGMGDSGDVQPNVRITRNKRVINGSSTSVSSADSLSRKNSVEIAGTDGIHKVNDNVISSTTSGQKVANIVLNVSSNNEVTKDKNKIVFVDNKEPDNFIAPPQRGLRANKLVKRNIKSPEKNVSNRTSKRLKKNENSKLSSFTNVNDKECCVSDSHLINGTTCNEISVTKNSKSVNGDVQDVCSVQLNKNSVENVIATNNQDALSNAKENVPVNDTKAAKSSDILNNFINQNYNDKINAETTKVCVQTSMPSMSISSDTSKTVPVVILKTSKNTPSISVSSETSKKTSCSDDLQTIKDSGEKKVRIKEYDSGIILPCQCKQKRIQCFSQYSGESFFSKKIFGKGIEVNKSLKHEKSIMAGYMKIHVNSSISGRATNNTVYFVVEGCLRVNIAGTVKIVKDKDCFMVIQDTEYEIRNIHEDIVVLSFVKTSRIL